MSREIEAQQSPPSVESALSEAAQDLADVDHAPFSDRAAAVFEQAIAEYIRGLAIEAERCARRQRNENISSADVEQAARYLFAGYGRGKAQHIGTVGGLLLGSSLGNGLALIGAESPNAWGVAGTILLLLMGTILLTASIVRDAR